MCFSSLYGYFRAWARNNKALKEYHKEHERLFVNRIDEDAKVGVKGK